MVTINPKRSAQPSARSSKRLPPHGNGGRDTRQRLHDDRQTHGHEERGVERRANVEVTGRAAPGLQIDDADLEDQDNRGHPSDEPARARPFGKQGEDPREGQHVDGSRDGELGRLEPHRRAGDHAFVGGETEQREGPARRASAGRRRSAERSRSTAGPAVVFAVFTKRFHHVLPGQRFRCCRCQHQDLTARMLTMSTSERKMDDMAPAPARRPARKRANHYHHGDLRRAMLQAAVRTIRTHGIDGLTLRGVGSALGVSRTALYRHFTDKAALLAAVAAEGFRMLRLDLEAAWNEGGRGRAGFEAMGVAYVRFAVAHPSHYRVMFGADIPKDGGGHPRGWRGHP